MSKFSTDLDVDFGSSWGRFGLRLGGHFRSFWRLGRPKLVPRPSSNRLNIEKVNVHETSAGVVPERFQGPKMAPKTAQDRFFMDFGSSKDRFSLIFEGFLVAFRSSHARRRHKSRISKRSRAILSARLDSCIVESLRTARRSFDMTFEYCMFSLFSLRTHECT